VSVLRHPDFERGAYVAIAIIRINRPQFNPAADASLFDLKSIPIVSETSKRSFDLRH
jgi:hypothetical protein